MKQHERRERLRLTEAASEYGLHPDTLRRWIRQQRLDGELVGGIWYVFRPDVEHTAGPGLRAQLQQLQREYTQLSQQQERLQRDLTATRDALVAQKQQLHIVLRHLGVEEADRSITTAALPPKQYRPKKMPILRWLAEHGIPVGTSKGWAIPLDPTGDYDKAHVLKWVLQHLQQTRYRGRAQLHRCHDPADVCVTLLSFAPAP